jgi:hypothetical protein
MPIVLENTAISGLAAGGLPNGVVTANTLASESVTTSKLSGIRPVVAIHTFNSGARQVTSLSNDYTYFSFTISKVSSTSTLIIRGVMPAQGGNNSGAYLGIGIDGTVDYTGCALNDEGEQQAFFQQVRTGISSGTRTITIRQIPIDGTANQTLNVINPNSSDDARNRQQETNFIIWEMEL